jgi:hypothetical protein
MHGETVKHLKIISSLFFLAEGKLINLILNSAGNVPISFTSKRITDSCHDLSCETSTKEDESVAVSRPSVACTSRLQNRLATYVTAC